MKKDRSFFLYTESKNDVEFEPVVVATADARTNQTLGEEGASTSLMSPGANQGQDSDLKGGHVLIHKYAATTTRRFFTMSELTAQGVAHEIYLSNLHQGGTLFPNLKHNKAEHVFEAEQVSNGVVSLHLVKTFFGHNSLKTSGKRLKSAPRSLLKNRTRTSKRQVFSFSVPGFYFGYSVLGQIVHLTILRF